MLVITRLSKLVALALIAATLSGCAAAMSYRKGFEAGQRRDWDAAVAHYRQAVQEDPDKPEYRIALERASMEAALIHAFAGKEFEAKGELDAALREFKRASEYEPSNRQLAAKVAELDRVIREKIEASRPRSRIAEMRDKARRMSPDPILNPASREPINWKFGPSASVRDILNFIGAASGINVTFTGDYREPPGYTVQLDGVTVEQALQQVLSANALFYKVLNERTILVIPDNVQNRAKYEEQVIRTFYLSHADAQEMVQLLNVIGRVQGSPIVPAFVANKNQNSVTVRATAPLVAIMERIIESNDRPRAEVIVDVQILEVNRSRAKQFGLELSNYSVTGIFSPEKSTDHAATTASVDDAALQPQHDHRGHQRGGLLSRRADRRRPLPGDRLADQAGRQAPAARSGRRRDQAEPRRSVPRAVDDVWIARRRRQCRHAAHFVVQLRAGRHHRQHDAAGDLRRRHRAEARRREQHARTGREHRRPEPAVVRIPQGRDDAAAARRRVDAAGRVCCARTSAGPSRAFRV